MEKLFILWYSCDIRRIIVKMWVIIHFCGTENETMKGKNKGFSLIELIVVIAIMAVLVGILAPAYIRYVEKSRKSKDVTMLDEVLKAANTVSTDEEYHVPVGAQFQVTASGGKLTLTVNPWDDILDGTDAEEYRQLAEDEWKDIAGKETKLSFSSKEWRAMNGHIFGEVNADGLLDWQLDASNKQVFESMTKFSASFKQYFSA